MERYLRNVWAATWAGVVQVDRIVNALLGGDPEMTLSGRMGRAVANGDCWGCRGVCWLLDMIDPKHCAKQATVEASEGSDEIVKL